MQRTAREPLYRQVGHDLEEQIAAGELVSGDKLLSERQLCEQYDVSQITVRRALRELAHEGKVYSQHGLGWFVAGQSSIDTTQPHVALIADDMGWPTASIVTQVSALLMEAEIYLHLWMWSEGESELGLAELAQDEIALALYCPACAHKDAVTRCGCLDTWETPVLGVGYELDKEPQPGVYLDVGLASQSITEHLLRRGRERLAYLGASPSSTLGRLSYWSFAEAVWGAGLNLRLEWVLDEDGGNVQRERVAELLRASSRPDGIVCTSAEGAASALSAVYAAGLRCPDDVALVSLGDKTLLERLIPAVTSYGFDMKAVGDRVARAVESGLAGESVGIERVTGDLRERFSSRV